MVRGLSDDCLFLLPVVFFLTRLGSLSLLLDELDDDRPLRLLAFDLFLFFFNLSFLLSPLELLRLSVLVIVIRRDLLRLLLLLLLVESLRDFLDFCELFNLVLKSSGEGLRRMRGLDTLLSLLLLPPFGLFLCALSLPSLDNLSKLLVLDCSEHLDGLIVRYWNIRSFICRL